MNAKSLLQYNTLWLSGIHETSVCFHTEKFWVFDVSEVFTMCGVIFLKNPLNHKTTV